LGIILLIGAFLRLYKIGEYMTFLGDEGRDSIIVRRIFTELHPPLIGPGTSVGNMYLGPLYYYLMAIPLLVSGFSPVGPAVMVALLGVITIAFVWWVGRSWFDKKTGIIAAGLYAISPTIITFSHSSWNPNIMPFFSLLCMYSIWRVYEKKEFNWLITLGISFAFVLQSHYFGLFLAPAIFVFWLLTLKKLKSSSTLSVKIGIFLRNSLLGILVFCILMSPLLIFDFRHSFMNTKSIYKFIAERQTTISVDLHSVVSKVPDVFNLFNSSLIAAKNQIVALIVSVSMALGVLWMLLKRNKSQYWLLFIWLTSALIGFAIYKLPIYDHYFGFVFVVPFILIGATISGLFKMGKISGFIASLALILLVITNLIQNPFRFHPNSQLQRAKNVAAEVMNLSDNKSFNLAVIAERNYEDGYKYFLDLWGGKALHADRWDPSTISEQLFVICENEPLKCDPTHSPKAEVANFGMTKIVNQWQVDGVIIYKLAHTK
jgi:4-amino-4-deoxy-L-arabinose transferase-like glycosyltransferase